MRSSLQPKTLLAFLSLVGNGLAAYEGHYFVLRNGDPLVSERLDPIVSPGQNPASHVHNIFGSSSFSETFDFNAAQNAKCNTNGVKADMSNYWYPALYFHDKSNDSYTMVPTQLITYYKYDPINGKPRTAFPPGLKIMAGNAMLRHYDATSPSSQSIKWNCHGPDVVSQGGFGKGFTGCNSYPGFAAEIRLPFCYDGVNEFDLKNPYAHVVYGQGSDGTILQEGGVCPSSHPIALPQLFMEMSHDTSRLPSWGADEQPFVLSPGDNTGYSFHVDFISGWNVDVLQNAINNCRVGVSGAPLSDCFEMLDDDVRSKCKIASTVSDLDVVNPGASLPGCNPIQEGPEDATLQTNCAGDKAPGLTKRTSHRHKNNHIRDFLRNRS